METKFIKDALFNGMTANAFKLGTVLSFGWFWQRLAGCHSIYRGQDGNFDYDKIQAIMELGDSQVSIPNQALPGGTNWHYIRRKISCCGLESPDSPAGIVRIAAEGDMLGKIPNSPLSLQAKPLAGGKVKLRWRYSPIGQEIAPTGFRIFIDSGSGFDFNTPEASVSYGHGARGEFAWTSDALSDGTLYRFCVRSYRLNLGPELLANGNFDNSKHWYWGDIPLWSLVDGKARFEAVLFSYDDLRQYRLVPEIGKTYRVVFTILAISGADITVDMGAEGTQRTMTGTFSEDIEATNTGAFEFYADSFRGGDYCEIDNVSVREVKSPDTETLNTDFVSAVADDTGPDAVTGLQVSWSEK